MKTNAEMITTMNTYFVSGVLERETLWEVSKLSIYREIEAVSVIDAADSLEKYNWLWIEPPTVRLITEAEKMEKAGQPPLFPLADYIKHERLSWFDGDIEPMYLYSVGHRDYKVKLLNLSINGNNSQVQFEDGSVSYVKSSRLFKLGSS